jgi:ABC transporter substrate binding protein
MQRAQVEGVNVLASPILNAVRSLIVQRLLELRVPAIYEWPETAEEGGLIGYGARITLCYRHVAVLVDRVLRGAKAGELPIEQPSILTLAINARTAEALGLTIPPTRVPPVPISTSPAPRAPGSSNTSTRQQPERTERSRRCVGWATPSAPTPGCGSSWRLARWARRRRMRATEIRRNNPFQLRSGLASQAYSFDKCADEENAFPECCSQAYVFAREALPSESKENSK